MKHKCEKCGHEAACEQFGDSCPSCDADIPTVFVEEKEFKIGEKVRYRPNKINDEEYENGIVKGFPPHTKKAVFVVYHCNNDWDNYQNYTAALTNTVWLERGWK